MNTGSGRPVVETIPPAPRCKCQRIGRFMRPFVRWTCPVHGEMPKDASSQTNQQPQDEGGDDA